MPGKIWSPQVYETVIFHQIKTITSIDKLTKSEIYPHSNHKNSAVNKEAILQSIITCPACGHEKEETMPTNACQYFYECTNCKKVLKPTVNDCCVYCSYGTVACPPIQLDQDCC